jgi:biopolymer transport protein ExbB/TolQ
MTNDETTTKQQGLNTAGKVLSIIGALCQVGPFVGLTGTVIGMVKAFDRLGTSGTSDPATLSAAIGEVLISFISGLVVSLVGMALLLTGISMFNYRRKWAKVLLIILGIIWLILILGAGAFWLMSPPTLSTNHFALLTV